ncbi:restriction endonuclease subunit S [Aeromonas hydrophila]
MMAEQMIHHKEGEKVATQAIPTGFKQSEVGVIPEDWLVEPLENFTSFISYGFTNPMPTTASGPYMVTARDISNGKILYDSARTTDWSAFHKLLTAKSKPQLDDVLLTKDGTLGRVALVENELICINQSVAILRPNKRIYPKFFKCLLDAPLYQAKMLEDAGGSTIKHIYITIVNKMVLGLPANLTEQTAIANVLSDSDALIDALEQLIAKKQAIKTAVMQQLLTGRARLPQFALRPDGTPKGYKTSELGQIPEDWDALTYGDIFTFLSTATNSRADLSNSGDFGYIHYGDIHTKWNNKLDLCVFDLPRVSRHLVSSSFVENGDVIMADASEDYDGIGKSVEICNVGDDKIVSGLHTFLLRDKNKLLVDGYRGFLHSIPAVKKAFDRLATGMKVYGISKNNLIVVPVPLPPKQEQTAIATILTDMDSELTALEQKLAKARDVKQGMMQQLLTGRIRLPLPQEA